MSVYLSVYLSIYIHIPLSSSRFDFVGATFFVIGDAARAWAGWSFTRANPMYLSLSLYIYIYIYIYLYINKHPNIPLSSLDSFSWRLAGRFE